MVGPAGLNPRARRRLLALALLVVLAHALALYFMSRWHAQKSLLKPMAAPMYTRLLQPQAPPPAPEPVMAQAAPPPPTGRLQAAPSVPRKVTPTVAQRPEPEPEPELPAAPPREPEPPIAQSEPAPPEPGTSPAPAESSTPAAEPDTATAGAPMPAASAPLAAATAPGAGDGWPVDTRLRYRLSGRFRSGELYGDARVLWQRQGARYQARVEVELGILASLIMTSQGEVGAFLKPEVYEEERNRRPPRGVRFTADQVQFADGRTLARPAGVQDTASQFVELSHRFATGREKLEIGRAVSFWMARPGAVDLWTYDVVERESLRTPLGEIEAFHLKPRPIANPRGNITAEMWFAPSLQYLPVRIRVNMGEEATVDLLVEAIEQR